MYAGCVVAGAQACVGHAAPLSDVASAASVAWITGGLAITGVVIGGILTALYARLQARDQRKWQIADREAALTEARNAEVRRRMDEKADEVLQQLNELQAVFALSFPLRRSLLWPTDPDRSSTARALVAGIRANAAYLTSPLRSHVELVSKVLPDLERIVEENYYSGSARAAAFIIIRGATNNVARYLRGELVPADYSLNVEEVADAWQDLEDYLEHSWEQEEAAASGEPNSDSGNSGDTDSSA